MKIFKKCIFILFFLIMVVSLAGCKQDISKDSKSLSRSKKEITDNQRLAVALQLQNLCGDFDSMSEIPAETILMVLTDVDDINCVDFCKNTDMSVKAQFLDVRIFAGDADFDIYEFEEIEVKNVAKELLGIELPDGKKLNLVVGIKYKKGKYYRLHNEKKDDGIKETIGNISKDGNTYIFENTFEYNNSKRIKKKYKAIIENGTIMSCKEIK